MAYCDLDWGAFHLCCKAVRAILWGWGWHYDKEVLQVIGIECVGGEGNSMEVTGDGLNISAFLGPSSITSGSNLYLFVVARMCRLGCSSCLLCIPRWCAAIASVYFSTLMRIMLGKFLANYFCALYCLQPGDTSRQRTEESECLTQFANWGSKAQGNWATCSPSHTHSVGDLVTKISQDSSWYLDQKKNWLFKYSWLCQSKNDFGRNVPVSFSLN